ncbi:MAG: HAD-IA family hydrolase [Nitrososphaerota archaeon]|nr:HAD-IA family hydrolase [Aigarchaeota archaeon]MDW8076164.1 HAD-IA family hydrolase [Nitrososphaerota archaeon]
MSGKEKRLRAKAVIFDLDGTLVEFKLKINDAKLKIISRLRELGLDPGNLSPEDSIQAIISKVTKTNGIVDKTFNERIKSEVFSIMENFELEAALAPSPRGDALKVLTSLKSMNIMVAVATNSCKKASLLTLQKCGMLTHVDVVVTRDDVERIKPANDLLKKALSLLGISSDEAVYVGDTTYDIEAAKSIGVKSVAVLGGVHSENMLAEKKPDFIIKSLSELLNIIQH